MAKDVKCKVDDCKFYVAGDLCTAKAIEVTHEAGCCHCSNSGETICKTFQPK